MQNATRTAFAAYQAQIASLNGVTNAAEKFAVSPTVEQKLETRIREQADFLGAINIVGVDQQTGEVLGMDASGPVAGRTNTTTADRQPRDLLALDGRTYLCHQTNFDTSIKYATLDAWAKFSDFQTRLRNIVMQQVARDRLMIGWHGTSAAAHTDIAANPLLQDVNIGWLQALRDKAPQRVMTNVKIGDQAGADYKTIDAAVFDVAESLLDDWHKEAPDIRAIVGRNLLSDKYLGLIEAAGDKATEIEALKSLTLTKAVGGRQAQTVPYFPAKSILLTAPKNLAVYYQNGTRRRMVVDNPKRDRIEDFMSVNEAYVIEDLGKACLIDGVLTPDGAGGWH